MQKGQFCNCVFNYQTITGLTLVAKTVARYVFLVICLNAVCRKNMLGWNVIIPLAVKFCAK